MTYLFHLLQPIYLSFEQDQDQVVRDGGIRGDRGSKGSMILQRDCNKISDINMPAKPLHKIDNDLSLHQFLSEMIEASREDIDYEEDEGRREVLIKDMEMA